MGGRRPVTQAFWGRRVGPYSGSGGSGVLRVERSLLGERSEFSCEEAPYAARDERVFGAAHARQGGASFSR